MTPDHSPLTTHHSQTPVLEAHGLCKSFAGVRALKGVSFDLLPGEVHALVGENGAGKSTLIKIITGAYQADAGSLHVGGREVADNNPVKSRSLGIAAIYQLPALFPDLTVMETIAFGLEPVRLWRRVDWRGRRRSAQELLGRVGTRISPDALCRTLTMPEQQLVEIARALGAEARALIMDEPTASLPEQEVQNLFRVIRALRTSGVGVLYISHRLEELFEVADRVTVLRDGSAVATRPMADVNRADLIRLMVGRELSTVFPKRELVPGDTVLEARNLGCSAGGVKGVSFSARAGEVLGFAGLVGSGRTELAKTLFGLTPADSGEVFLKGRRARIGTPEAAAELGLAYVPEDRRRHGVIPEMPVVANATLALLRNLSRNGFLDFDREKAVVADFVHRLDVRTPSLYTPTVNLSGGNQQKVALARWLVTDPKVIILDEPTQGIDVGAKWEIHRLMCDLAEQGRAVLMISSDLPEVLGMSDRIVVMREGTVAGILGRAEATQERILSLALGQSLVEAQGARSKDRMP